MLYACPNKITSKPSDSRPQILTALKTNNVYTNIGKARDEESLHLFIWKSNFTSLSLPALRECAANTFPRQAVRISPANVLGEYLLLIQMYIPSCCVLHEDSHSTSPMPLVTLAVKVQHFVHCTAGCLIASEHLPNVTSEDQELYLH